ncbi:RelA/SpoT domain-containing protein [Gluconobacter kondonii]|uniref:RelA/SpoT domain-containing protein n=1 Tax=Gluconobacter kondonii TaxID=941463 RepID=UPI001B8C4C46|nr:RelA/SpoT domain-containing protein [Gluconobacter kondonii]MBS1057181.1 RelA/SpoT domain-containing protein [Gluconobacter kondonii]
MDSSALSIPSKKRIKRAGEAVRDGADTLEDREIIDLWRTAHRNVLNSFQAILRGRARYKPITVAQRHKRRNTIFDKLRRFPTMNLARMDDVAGCRVIFDNIISLNKFRKEMHAAKFHHTLKNTPDKYDYISNPKDTGYRGIHDIYEYDVNSVNGTPYRGLNIEIQYRTRIQHAWATAVEVIGSITDSQPKFQSGDRKYEYIMSLASEMLARVYENRNSCHPEMDNSKLAQTFVDLDSELKLTSTLSGLSSSKSNFRENKNYILVFGENEKLDVKPYKDSTSALKELFLLENKFPGRDIVLVRANSSNELKDAFRNYFSDATEFVQLIEKACHDLSGARVRSFNDKAFSGLDWPSENWRK